jgi:O-antigen/teichoic acid export membrane protein
MKSIAIIAAATLAMATKGFVASAILDITQFASYSVALLWSQISVLVFSAGSVTSLQVSTAKYLQKNTGISFHYSQAVTLVLVNFLLTSLVVCIVYNFNHQKITPMLLGLIAGSLQLLFLLITTKTKSRLDFLLFAKIMAAKSLLVIGFMLAVASFSQKFYSLLLAEIIAMTAILTIAYFKEFSARNIKLKLIVLKINDYQIHLKYLILSLSTALFLNIDRLIGFEKLTPIEIATFGVVYLGVGLAATAQSVLNSIIFPKLTHEKIEQSQHQVVKTSLRYTSIALAVFTLGLCMALPVLKGLFGTYMDFYGLDGNILYLAMLIMVLRGSDFLSNAFLILDKERILIGIRLMLTAISATCIFTLTTRLEEILIITVLASFIYSLGLAAYLLVFNEHSL